ncbi:MAG: nicotinate-nucleotide adenylyltransferase [Thomasclavelia sp.]|jgi:nicotinate-nucleotide adenylyltransferase|nr:nicotinate-nucleotide adenylyltransferase [Thomasclavelia sp.]
MSKIGIFGGTFDPIHKGHTKMMEIAIDKLSLDMLLVIPTKNNPWKDSCEASNDNRIEMISIALRNLKKAKISRIEIDDNSDDKSYTTYTIDKLKKLYPNDELYYIVGMDQASSFDKWFEAKKIANNVQMVVCNRKGYQPNDNIKKFNFIELENDYEDGSSTGFKDGNIEYVDKEVLRYATNHGLYLEYMIKCQMKDKRYKHSLSVASLCKEFALSNNVNPLKAYIAGMMHDVAKEMDDSKAEELMNKYYPNYVAKPRPIWHQWLSSYMCKNVYLIDDDDILKAIEDHTTGSTSMSKLGKCLYCADKYDPTRGYDSSKEIQLCKENIDEGFKQSLIDFYNFSKEKHRDIDEVFFGIYDKYVKGEFNG